MYNVLIVEDQRMPRELLEIHINSSNSYNLVASITNADTAIKICQSQKIDLILMDVLTDLGSNGLDASQEIKKQFPNIKIIVVTSMPEASWLSRAKEIGIESFWYKEASEDSIISVMDKTMAGESIYPLDTPEIKIGLSNNHEFTERETDVLREIITGDSNTTIGERLGMSAGTVKIHIQHMLYKTGFKTRTELAAHARALGIAIK
ncbi:MAG: response regulator transcription factor [Clostridia bacterium]|nr:response regulator transcription factor [Clostridia bacterium]